MLISILTIINKSKIFLVDGKEFLFLLMESGNYFQTITAKSAIFFLANNCTNLQMQISESRQSSIVQTNIFFTNQF
jgi:hypothetical protein